MALTMVVYQAILVISILITTAAMYTVLNSTDKPGARPLLLLLGGSFVWLVVTLVYTVVSTFDLALLLSKATYVGIALVPIGWFLFALEYTGRENYVKAPLVALLLLEAVAINAIVWVRRELVWATVTDPGGPGGNTVSEVIEFGSWGVGFYGHAAFSYALVFVGAALVFRSLLGSLSSVHRGQAISMLVAVVAPTLGNIVYLALSFAGVLTLDLTPIMFGISGGAIVVGMYRYSLVSESPLASEAGINERDVPAFVVDDDGTIVDCNVQGAAVLGVDADTVPGTPVEEAFADTPKLLTAYRSGSDDLGEVVVQDDTFGDEYTVSATEVSPAATPRTGTLFELDQV